jgi:hypothetical protein
MPGIRLDAREVAPESGLTMVQLQLHLPRHADESRHPFSQRWYGLHSSPFRSANIEDFGQFDRASNGVCLINRV